MIPAMLDMRIQQHFIDSADLQYQLGVTLAQPLDSAVQAILACVTGGGKVLVAGLGPSHSLAQYLVRLLVGGFERERPGLPAIGLLTDALSTAFASLPDMLARQVQALGLAGDLLVLFSGQNDESAMAQALEAAHAREMTVVAVTAGTGSNGLAGLRETDVQVNVPHERAARVREVQLLALHCLCDGIDAQLLGEQELT